jgi:hypothetical protein
MLCAILKAFWLPDINVAVNFWVKKGTSYIILGTEPSEGSSKVEENL